MADARRRGGGWWRCGCNAQLPPPLVLMLVLVGDRRRVMGNRIVLVFVTIRQKKHTYGLRGEMHPEPIVVVVVVVVVVAAALRLQFTSSLQPPSLMLVLVGDWWES